MTKEELGERLSSPEISWWQGWDRVHCLPDPHWDAALIASTIASAMTGKKFKLEDFLPKKGEKPKGANPAAVLGMFAQIRARAERADTEQRRREG